MPMSYEYSEAREAEYWASLDPDGISARKLRRIGVDVDALVDWGKRYISGDKEPMPS